MNDLHYQTPYGPISMSEDFAHMLQTIVEDLYDSFPDMEEGNIPAPSGAIFCGCECCCTRELLYAIVPAILRGAREGLVEEL